MISVSYTHLDVYKRQIVTITDRMDETSLPELVRTADVVLDCTDNFKTRLIVNRACMAAGVPLVSGAVVQFDGQISVYDPRRDDSPCYACLLYTSRCV